MATSSKPAWVVPFAICCLFLIGLLLAATIILALIPVYLTTRKYDISGNSGETTLSALYASNAADGRSLTLADTNSLSTQMLGNSGLSSTSTNLDAGGFIDQRAAARKRRQTTNDATFTCEKATGLTGDIFGADYQLKYPAACFIKSCRSRYVATVTNALRMNYRKVTVSMNFTGGEKRDVQLVFCGISTFGSGACTTETKSYMYLVGRNSTLYQFNPTNQTLVEIGNIGCPTMSTLIAIAVQRIGNIWALFDDGNLFRYNIRSATCVATKFVANQSDFSQFTMTFVKSSTDNTEKLYVSKGNNPTDSLGTIDLNTLTLTRINNYSNISTNADLASTSDNRLFGLFETSPFTIAQINPTNAAILAQYPIAQAPSSAVRYGFAAYKNQLYVFNSNGTSSDVFVFDPAANTTTTLTSISPSVYSASASSCLGT